MLETVVAKFITKYLCEYIETINKNQMEMKLWEGHATFENLILLPTALAYHNLPFKIIKGIIKRVKLNFPWKKLDTEACIIEIEDVFILVEPDPDVLIKNDIEAQQSAIHISLTNSDYEKDTNANQEISKEFEVGTWQSLINTVIDNARISIKNIHIRIEHNYLQSKTQSAMPSELPSVSPSTSSLNSYATESDKTPNKEKNNNRNEVNNNNNNEDSDYDDEETKFVAGGLIIPELTLFTVDDDNKPLLKIVQASPKLRKQFKLNNLSVYFDTHDQKSPKIQTNFRFKSTTESHIPIDPDADEYFTKPVNLNKFEEEMKSIMNDINHQYILNPFYIEGILLHTRNIPDMLKNMIEITTHQLKFSMDYDQEQIFLHFNREWNRFTKRRRYASCARPKGTINSKEKVSEFWQYFTRCAIQRCRPNEFNPKLALVILKNRLKYLKLIRKYETQSNIMHPLLDSQLKTLDKKVGTSAALFCRAYSKAVVTKELNVKNSGITAFDLSELKSLLKTTDRFFDIDSFSAKLNIPSFQVEFLYEKNDPFLVAEFRRINLIINSVKGGADVHFSIDDFNVMSYVDDVEKSIVYVEFANESKNSSKDTSKAIENSIDSIENTGNSCYSIDNIVNTNDSSKDIQKNSSSIENTENPSDSNKDTKNTSNSIENTENPNDSSKDTKKTSNLVDNTVNTNDSNENIKNNSYSIENTKNSFFKVDLIIPSTTDPFQMNVYLEPTVTIIDSITIDRVLTFFEEKDNSNNATSNLNLIENDKQNVKINRIDAADTFQRLLYFKNHVLNVKLQKLKYIFPFEYQCKQTSINFALKDFTINKSAVGLLAQDKPEVKMDFRVHFIIDDLMIDECCILKEFQFDFPFFFKFFTRIDQVCLDCNFVFGKIKLKIGEKELKLIVAAINYGKMIKLTEKQRDQLMNENLDKNEISSFLSRPNSSESLENISEPKSKTIISFGKVIVNLSFNFKKIKFIIDHANTSIAMHSINFTYKITKGESDGLCKIGKVQFIENNDELLKLPNDSVKIVAYQKDETEKLKISFIIDNLQLLMELRRYKQIYLKMTKILNRFINEIDFESFLLNYNKNYRRMNLSENSETNRSKISLLNSKTFYKRTNSKFNFELEKGKSTRSSSFKLNKKDEVNDNDLFNDETHRLSAFFDDVIEIQKENEEEKVKDDNDDSLFEYEFLINNFEMLIPDIKAKYLITIGKLSISDHIEMTDFGCFRENRILIKPMPIVLYFDQLKNMKLGHLDSQFEPSDLYAILRLYADINYFFSDPTEEEDEESNNNIVDDEENENNKKKGSQVVVSFESSRFDLYHFNTHLFIVRTKEVIIDVRARKNEVFTFITINEAKANQFIYTNDSTKPKLYEFVDFNDPIIYKYHSKGENSSFQLIFPETTAYFTRHDFQFIFRWIPEKDDLTPSENAQSENSKSHHRIKCASSKVVMMQGAEQVGTLVFNELCIDMTWIGNSGIIFELKFSDINGYTNLLSNNFHFISLPYGFYLRYHDSSLLIKGKQVIVSFNIPLLLKVINTLIEILSTKDESTPFIIDINYKIEVDEVLANFYPLEMIGPLTYVHINNTKFALKAQQKLVAMSIDNILIDVANANPDRALAITNFRGFVCLNEEISLIEKMKQMEIRMKNIDEVCGLEDNPNPDGFILNKIEGIMNAENITINYTHRAAAAVVLGCIPKDKEFKALIAEYLKTKEPEELIFEALKNQQNEIMAKYELKPIIINKSEPNIELTSNQNTGNELILTVSVDSFHFVLYLIDPLATIEFLDLTAKIKDKKWNATMGEFHLYKGSDVSSDLIKSQEDSNLLNFKRKEDLYLIELAEMEVCIDLAFYLSVTNFILRSPFLHISDLQNHKEEIKSNSMASFPVNLKVEAPKLRITIPTAIGENSKIWPLFHIDMNCKLHLVETTVELDVSNFSVSFSNQITQDHYVPLIDNVTIKLIKKSSIVNDLVSCYDNNENEEDDDENNLEVDKEDDEIIYATSLTFYLSEIELKLSVIDLILFENMITDISKATDSIIFAEDNTAIKQKQDLNNEIKSNSITSVTFQTEKFRVIVCKDNKTSSKYIPLFNLVIPPISFKLNNTEANGSTMKLCISPYVEYFNESTGLWDMIIEPFDLKVHGEFLNNIIKISFKVDSNLNINLPLIALTQFLALFDMKKSQLLDFGEYVEFPNFWIENNLGRPIGFKLGNEEKRKSSNFFNLVHQQHIPVYQLDQSTEIHINVDDKTYSCIPKLLTYPTFLSCDICVVRKPYYGGINIIIKSTTELENGLDFDVFIYSRRSNSNKASDKSYVLNGVVKSKQRFPLLLPTTINDSTNKTLDFLIVKKELSETTKIKRQVISLSKRYPRGLPYPILLTNFLIGINENNVINVNISLQNEASTGTRLYKLYSPYVMVSHLPLDSFKVKIDGTKYSLSNNETVKDLYLSEKSSSVNMKVSLYGEKYGPITRIKICPNSKTQTIQTELPTMFIAVAFDTTSIGSEDNKVTTVIFFSPCIIYNNTSEFLTVYEYDPKNAELNLSINIPISKYGLYMPKSFIRSTKMTKYIQLKVNSSKDSYNPIDVQTPRTSNIFVSLNSSNDSNEKHSLKHIKYGIRYDVSIKKLITVVTFYPLIKVKNELKSEITLQALHKKNKKLKGDLVTVPSLLLNDSSEMSIIKMTTSGIFALTIPSISVSIKEVCLIKEQRICFRFYRDDENEEKNSFIHYYLVELIVTDVGTHYEALFREATFPTPVLIENCLPVEIKAFQLDESKPFEIDPDSTSVFGFDDPLDCTSLYFLFKDGQRLHISTAQETRSVETYVTILSKDNKITRSNSISSGSTSLSKKNQRVPVSVEVKLLINGSMAVILSYKRRNKRRTFMRISSSSLLTSSSMIESTQSLPQTELIDELSISTDNKSDSEGELRLSLSSLDSATHSMSFIPLTNSTQFLLSIHSIRVSLIDMQTREVALITLDGIKGNLEHKNNAYKLCASIKGIQIDDQDISAPNPVFLIGHSKMHIINQKSDEEEVEENPFFRLECLIPSDVPFPSRFSYLSANFQRVDTLLDSAFLSDFIYLFLNFFKPTHSNVGNQQKSKSIIQNNTNEKQNQNEDKNVENKERPNSFRIFNKTESMTRSNKTLSININWLQMSPIYMIFGYNRKSGRKKQFNEMFSALKYIPSLSPDEVILPGVVMEHLIGEPDIILEKVSSEYKTATFNQIIQMLGSTGSLLQTFGITNLIAELLGVKVDSDLIRFPTSEKLDSPLSSTSSSDSPFDNRREICGPFSNESLYQIKDIIKSANFKSSHVINALINNNKSKIVSHSSKKESNNNDDNNDAKNSQLKHHNIDLFEMYINRSITNGIFGILKGNGLEKRSNIFVKEPIRLNQSRRKRVPRAFLNNKIEIFDEKYAIAQETVGNGRIRMAGHLATSDNTFINKKKLLVVLTDTFIYILSPDMKAVFIKIDIALLDRLSVSNNLVTVSTPNKIVVSKNKHFKMIDDEPECIIECDSEEMASRMYVFIQSQRLMFLTYGTSLID